MIRFRRGHILICKRIRRRRGDFPGKVFTALVYQRQVVWMSTWDGTMRNSMDRTEEILNKGFASQYTDAHRAAWRNLVLVKMPEFGHLID